MIVRCHTSILMALECTYKKNVSRKVSERKMECEKSKGKFLEKLTTGWGRREEKKL